MNTPLVSVVIPTLNRKELLLYAIRSVLGQSYKNIQLVVHDNNSTDGTDRLLDQHFQDPRLEYHRSDIDLTMTQNWSAGLKYVRGEYFVRLDDDNVFFPDFIQRSVDAVTRDQLDVVLHSPLIIEAGGQLKTLFRIEPGIQVLSKLQLCYLEYLCLTDSNYALYKVDSLRKYFPSLDLYHSSLPDRLLNYRLSEHIDGRHSGIKVGISAETLGVTRFDYRPRLPQGYQFKFVNYKKLFRSGGITQSKDCQNNFIMHRINTLHLFLSETKDSQISDFFKNILSPRLYVTLMKIGHANEKKTLRGLRDLYLFDRYYFSIMKDLLRNPGSLILERKAGRFLLGVTKFVLRENLLSVLGWLIDRDNSETLDQSAGDRVVEGIIRGEASAIGTVQEAHQPIGFFLYKADQLSKAG